MSPALRWSRGPGSTSKYNGCAFQFVAKVTGTRPVIPRSEIEQRILTTASKAEFVRMTSDFQRKFYLTTTCCGCRHLLSELFKELRQFVLQFVDPLAFHRRNWNNVDLREFLPQRLQIFIRAGQIHFVS